MNTTILYLESWVESSSFLPPDLQRQLNTIRAVDDKCIELSDTIQQNIGQCLAMPPQHVQGPTEEFLSLSSRIEIEQQQLLQFAEEKVQVAQQVYDLLEMHAVELEKQIDDLEGDLRAQGIMDSGMEFYSPPSFVPMDSIRGRAPKVEDWNTVPSTPMENIQVPLPAMPSIKRSVSTVGQKASQKRPREEDAAPPPPPPPPLAAPSQTLPILTAASAPVSAPATAQPKKKIRSVQSSGSILSTQAPPPIGIDDGAFGQNGIEPAVLEQTQVIGFMNAPPPGLQTTAPLPQAPGKYLLQSGITEELVGRHAELFWPPDSMWYLIEIQEVNAETKKARIMYATGDLEELDLDEIARDMHMSIVEL